MSLEVQEFLVKVIVVLSALFIVWKNANRPILGFVSQLFLKSGNVKMAMKLRPKANSACASDCSCPSTEK